MKPIAISIDSLDGGAARPLTFGLPFAPGVLTDAELTLTVRQACASDLILPIQTRPTARWPDGSVRWLLIDAILPAGLATGARIALEPGEAPSVPPLTVRRHDGSVRIDTGIAELAISTPGNTSADWLRLLRPLPAAARLEMLDGRDRAQSPRIDECEVEESGPLRASIRLRGRVGTTDLRFTVRLSAFAGTALLRLLITVENPRRARHRRGTWDLGDRGSRHFRDWSFVLNYGRAAAVIHATAERGAAPSSCDRRWEIYQDSSGGENWQSPNHRNARGDVPTTFRGYRLRADGAESCGARAEPIAGAALSGGAIAAAITDFWQSFPTAIEVDRCALRIRLFPKHFADLFELQGGEHKTREVWLECAADWSAADEPLAWTRRATMARAAPSWYAAAGVDPALAAAEVHPVPAAILRDAAHGPRSLASRREIIDEYGWRNYGDLFADHEERYYPGAAPLISHYNNQYDVLYGSLLQYLWSGDDAWRDIAWPLAHHVVDIDLYNTAEDRDVYNGGLFWHTDHYRDAGMATHRSYSELDRPSLLARYGGGPGGENNYTSGLLLFHYLTGDARAREAVLQLADWVIAMDDGRRNVLGLLDDGPTGWASRTRDDAYHGPGRGAGNSLNALLDGWLLSGARHYLDAAEQLIRRVVHPGDDPAHHRLLDVEARWSYLIFLQSLLRYADEKARCGERDAAYDYARQSLLTYGRWMAQHESPYFDRRAELQYPTEAWPVIDVLKGNVLRAIAHLAPSDEAERLAAMGDSLADRAWRDLALLPHRDSVRALSHLLVQARRDAHLRHRDRDTTRHSPLAAGVAAGEPIAFAPQRERVRRQLQTPAEWPRLMRRLLDRRVWRQINLRRP